jgi:hypothetical protein
MKSRSDVASIASAASPPAPAVVEQVAELPANTSVTTAATPASPPAPASDFLTLQCWPGAESGPISHGQFGYRAYLADPRDPHSAWLVDVPRDVAVYFIHAGFKPIGPARS